MEPLCSHSVYVLQQLQEQRILGLLCDCMLVVKGVCFKAHKNVLAAFSVYFRSLFQNSPAQKNDVFHLSIQDVGGIGQVLDYMYTSHLELNHDNVHALMEIANSLQVCNILNMCQAFLKPSISNSCSLTSDVTADLETVPGPSVSSEANENLDAVTTHDKLRNFYSRQESTVEPLPDSSHQLQPKKAVYLKKFNYLRTHLSEEEDEQQRSTGAVCVQQTPEPTNNSTDTLTSDPAETEISDPVELSEMKTAVAEETRPDGSSKVSTGHKYCCEICGKTCKHPSNMELHRRSHTGEKPFQCNVCGKSFSQAGNLQTHLRRHSGDKPYICELCGKSFAAAGDVQRHVIVHSGVRPHLCDLCGRGFSSFSNLKEHRRTHSAERDFICHCGKSFNTHRKLLKHTHTHSGEKPYSCLTCGRSFAGSGDLQRHKRTHTGERPYTCDACGKSFSRSAVLRRHCSSHCRPTGFSTTDGPMTEQNVTAATH